MLYDFQGGDFLSNALSAAQIDLQPYQFMEDDDEPKPVAIQNTDDESVKFRLGVCFDFALVCKQWCVCERVNVVWLNAVAADADRRRGIVHVASWRQ